jgi:hypothetical protein
MTKQEFETRTHVEVTMVEFENINEMYMASDVDKDEFCRLWSKMNHVRVARAKEAKEIATKQQMIKEKALDIVARMHALTTDWWADAMTSLRRKDITFLESIGLDMYSGCRYKSISEIHYEILCKFGMI